MSEIKDAKEMLAVAENDFKALKGMTDSEIFMDEVFVMPNRQ